MKSKGAETRYYRKQIIIQINGALSFMGKMMGA
jgi:hypothetical protein